ncbi:hypothetical protein Zm00014a_010914 [Zea mays]|uniref:Uncharacterized protein n=1 Tax=Zea mays TaxID=4577 RepID=A0A3L6DL27_MAIZE|nr:hypothetical protein Zm00014a_010914 [Zea mays]
MMVPASVATTSFVILLLFSLPSCLYLRTTQFSVEGVVAGASFPYSSDTSPDTDSRSGYCTSTRTLHIMHAPSFSPSSNASFVFSAFALFFIPNLMPSPTVAAASRPMLVDTSTGRVGHAPGLSPCVPSRRTWWRLPRLGYLSDESPGLRYWTTKTRSVAAISICYGVGGGLVSLRRVRAGKTLAFSRPSRTDAWCGCLSVWSCSGWFISPLACSLPIYLAVYYLCRLQMFMSSSCLSPATNMYVHLFPSHPALRNFGSDGGEG